MTHRLDGRYHHGRRGSRYYSNDLASSRDKTPLVSIVVIGRDEDFHTPSAHQYRSYSGRTMSDDTQQRTESKVDSSRRVAHENTATTSAAAFGASRRQFEVSHGPSMSDLSASRPDPIFDTNNTQVSFYSSMSYEYDNTPNSRVYESENSFTGSLRMLSATYSDSTASVLSEEPQAVNEVTHNGVSNAVVSFASSRSSLDSAEYDIRDTEASEHMRDSELGMMYTNSSRVAVSFDVGSVLSDV